MIDAYNELHSSGYAHSAEAWNIETGALAGGIYGVFVEGAFAGESMFYNEPNASKLSLLYLVDQLQARGVEWIDIQQLTPHMEKLGAKLISRDDFLNRLQQVQERHRLSPTPPWG